MAINELVSAAQRQADVDDVCLNIYLAKHEQWIADNPEYTQSPYTALIAELSGQMDLFEQGWAKE